MAITYPLTLSNTPASVRLSPVNRVAISESPFSGVQQTYQHPAQFWEAEVTYPPLSRAEAEPLVAQLTSLYGVKGTFLLNDPAGTTARGIATGTPVVNGASQTGGSLITDGWTASQTGILKSGDWIQLGSGSTARLHKVLADANSDGSGDATFDIWPNLRTSPVDGSAIVIASASGVFRLLSNNLSYQISSASHYGITFACREAL